MAPASPNFSDLTETKQGTFKISVAAAAATEILNGPFMLFDVYLPNNGLILDGTTGKSRLSTQVEDSTNFGGEQTNLVPSEVPLPRH
jgi:hypothetical protein